jgi:hypothetical protein
MKQNKTTLDHLSTEVGYKDSIQTSFEKFFRENQEQEHSLKLVIYLCKTLFFGELLHSQEYNSESHLKIDLLDMIESIK